MGVREWTPREPQPGEPAWVRKARRLLLADRPVIEVAELVGKTPATVRNWLAPGAIAATPASRIAESVLAWSDVGVVRALYFRIDGRRFDPHKHRENGGPPDAVFVVEHPFMPSLASCEDMVAEHEQTGEKVIYDELRWIDDPRVEEQAGPSVMDEWLLEQKVAEPVGKVAV